jgi:glutaredoxin
MRKVLFIALLGFGSYVAQKNGYSFLPKDGAFDEDGNPIVRVFVGPNCGQPCEDVKMTMTTRHVDYELVDVSSAAGQAYGIRRYPLTMAGDQQVLGNATDSIVSMLAETHGNEVLNYAERRAMSGHFDVNGKPRVVLYGTQWCGYCKKQRQFFADHGIEFDDVDVEASPAGKMAYDTLHGAGYPLVYVGYRRFQGYKEREIKDALAELM